jgi:hypothetical protein
LADSKAGPIAGGILLFTLLPLIIVVALIVGALSGMSTAASCVSDDSTSASFGWPTDRHEIDLSFYEPDTEGNAHSGVDFKVDEGSKVYAAADGKVTKASDDEVRIEHEKNQVETRYKYFKDIKVKVGQKVERGEQIGTSGSGSEAGTLGLSGEHLHFELWINKGDGLENTKPEDDAFGDESSGDGGCCGGGASGGDLVGTDNTQKAYNFMVAAGYSKEQAAGVVGNMIHESSVEPARLNGTAPGVKTHPTEAVGQDKAWGIVQWYPAKKIILNSRNEGVDDATIESLAYQLEFLRRQLEGKGPVPTKDAGDKLKAAKTVDDAAFAFARYFEIFSTNPSDPEFGARQQTAKEVFKRYSGEAPEQGSGGGCVTGGNGDIVKTALGLAWDTPGHGFTPRDGYADAVKKYNGSSGDDELTDCGVFVATVMVMSGVDKDYPRRGTDVQLPYLRNSGKYEIYDNLKDESQLQKGDIFIIDGHTYLYTGNYKGGDGKTYNAASASLHGHTPEASHVFFDDYRGHYTVARFKGGAKKND